MNRCTLHLTNLAMRASAEDYSSRVKPFLQSRPCRLASICPISISPSFHPHPASLNLPLIYLFHLICPNLSFIKLLCRGLVLGHADVEAREDRQDRLCKVSIKQERRHHIWSAKKGIASHHPATLILKSSFPSPRNACHVRGFIVREQQDQQRP